MMLDHVGRYGVKLELWKNRDASLLRKVYIRLIGWTFMGGWVRQREVHQALKCLQLNPKSILDAGCGDGANSIFLAEIFPGASIRATDWEATERFQGQLDAMNTMMRDLGVDRILVSKQNLFDLAEQERYDFILNIDVLEHIPGHKSIVDRFYQALHPGGVLMLHVPRAGKPSKSALLPREVVENLAKEHIGEMYEPDELYQLLASAGYSNIKVIETFQWLSQTAWEWDRIIYYRAKPLYPILLPCLKLMAWLGGYLRFGRSFGMLAIAERQH